MAVAYFLESLSRDTQQAVQDHKEAQLDAELERFMNHALGGKSSVGRPWASSNAHNVLATQKRRVRWDTPLECLSKAHGYAFASDLGGGDYVCSRCPQRRCTGFW